MAARILCAGAACLLGVLPASAKGPFVDAATRVPKLAVEMRYAGSDNFVGRPIAGYEAPRCLLTPQAAMALAKAATALAREDLGLKVFDCYRPVRAVADFATWARDPADTRMRAAYYPEVDKRDLFRLGYIAERSAHSRGSTVDLTLVRLSDASELDMGTPFDRFSPDPAPGSTRVAPAARANRQRLRDAMAAAGFAPYATEWWHFTLAREPFSRRAFDLSVR